jgi:hypothetical protein
MDHTVFYTVWQLMIRRDIVALSAILDKHWNTRSPDNCELFDIFTRFERCECLRVLLTKVPVTHLDTHYENEARFELTSMYSQVILEMIRAEILRRSLMHSTNLPTEVIQVICIFCDGGN